MKPFLIAALSLGLVGLAALVLMGSGSSPAAREASPAAPGPHSVAVRGITLTSTSVDLPVDDAQFPDGPHADVINANCTACHSASMVLTQPALAADQWQAEVTKMQDVYHARVDQADVPAIIAYLVAMPGQQATPTMAKAQDQQPKPPRRVSGRPG